MKSTVMFPNAHVLKHHINFFMIIIYVIADINQFVALSLVCTKRCLVLLVQLTAKRHQ